MRWTALAALIALGACRFDGAPAPSGGDPTADAPTDEPIVDGTTPTMDAAPCPAAPSGCTAFSCAATSCHYLCTTELSYPDAKARCESAGMGCLTRVDDALEDECLHAVAMPDFQAGTIAFIGFRQAEDQPATDAGWDWQCGDTSYLPPNWGTFEPNDNDNQAPFMEMDRENCAAITGGGAWLDVGCTEPRRYLCELER